MRALFSDNKLVVCGGSLFSAAFAGFRGLCGVRPAAFELVFVRDDSCCLWRAYLRGLPAKAACRNALGLPLMPCSTGCQPCAARWKRYAGRMVGAVRCFLSVGIGEAGASRRGKTAAVVLLLVACGAWAALFLAPPLQGVVTYSWKSTLSIPKAVVSGLLFMFTSREGVQPFLTLLVLLGVAKTLKDKKAFALAVRGICGGACVLRYRRFHRRLRQTVADGLLVHRLLPHRRHDGAVRHPACRAGLRLAGGAWLGWLGACVLRARMVAVLW